MHCDGKQRYASFRLATGNALRSRRNDKTRRSAYRCTHCNGWHLGSKFGKAVRRPRAEVEA